ncbi:MAG: hypothetical protein WEB53_02835 [Akkermansiaceae bacterium]
MGDHALVGEAFDLADDFVFGIEGFIFGHAIRDALPAAECGCAVGKKSGNYGTTDPFRRLARWWRMEVPQA